MILYKFCLKRIQNGLPLDRDGWHSDVLVYINDTWGYDNEKTGDQKKGWRSFTDSQIVAMLERYLPENVKAKGSSLLAEFEAFMRKEPLSINFREDLSDAKDSLLNQCTCYLLEFNRIEVREGISADQETHLVKQVYKLIKFNHVPAASVGEVQDDSFESALDLIKNVVLRKVDTLIVAQRFLPPLWEDPPQNTTKKTTSGNPLKSVRICPGCG